MPTLKQLLDIGSQYNNWNNIVNQRTRLEYYTGAEAGNPSGSTSNAKFIYFETLNWDGTLKGLSLKQQLTYDGNDNVLTVTAVTN